MTDSAPSTPGRFRLSAELRLGAVRLQVADLGRSTAYYRDVLGFRVLEQTTTAVTLGPHGEPVALIELRERAGARPVPQRGRLGLYHFAILLPDRAALGRLLAHLADIGAHVGSADHLVSEALYLRDPDGLGIEVYADRPRDSWRVNAGQIVMATDPLDTASLVAAGGGAQWTGIPAGTTVGHVHLHVGDIARAADFYHRGLGFDPMVWSYPGALFLAAGGYHHHLGLNTWAGADAVAPEPHDARLLEWTVALPAAALADAARNLQAVGERVESEGDDWVATDPWGTTVRLTPTSAGHGR
jgi:catechol 2,3-dioxygenase